MKFSVRTKFSLLILPLVGICLFLLLLLVAPYREIPQEVQRLQAQVSRTILTEKLARRCNDQIKGYSLAVLSSDVKHLADLSRLQAANQQDFLALGKGGEPDALLTKVRTTSDQYTQIGEKVVQLIQSGKREQAITVIHQELDEIADGQLTPLLGQLLGREEAGMRARLQEVQGMDHFLFLAPPRLHQSVQRLDLFIQEATMAVQFGRMFTIEVEELADLLLFPDHEHRQQAESARESAGQSLGALIQHIRETDPEDTVLPVLLKVQADHQAFREIGIQASRLTPESTPAEVTAILEKFEAFDDVAIGKKIDELAETEQAELQDEVGHIVTDARLAMVIIGGVSVLVVLIGLGSPWLLTRKIVRPIIELKEAAMRVGAGELDARVPIHSSDEVGELAATFNTMAERLKQNHLEREKAEQVLKEFTVKLERSNRELQDFASVASHDLQEPLRKIQAFGDRLKTKCMNALEADGKDYLERMLNAAGRMQTLINDLLTFSRITTKAQPFAAVDLTKIAGEVLADLEVRIQQSGGRVEVGALPTIDADPTQMRQLLQNLIGNALKFHKEGIPPVVKLSCPASNNGHCEIRVADNGIVFEEKYLDRIFAVFQRLHGRTTFEGTGIGLAVCRKIVERHGGTITANSQPGEGATFIVTLPTQQKQGVKAS